MITIDYFSDVLCIWAYGGQVRLDELQREFAGDVLVRHHFMGLFADTQGRIAEGWKDEGGFEGFAAHMQEVCEQWDHVQPSPDVWRGCRPVSCTTAHVFLKAVALCLGLEQDDGTVDTATRVRFDRLVGTVRAAFFAHGQDIARRDVLLGLLGDGDPTAQQVAKRIDDGEAYAALHRDHELAKQYGVLGSPTYVFNEGRQLLYGNVGYRIIESNMRELLTAEPAQGLPSWC